MKNGWNYIKITCNALMMHWKPQGKSDCIQMFNGEAVSWK